MSDITIVTAYFDIGRGNWNNSERGNNKYINYFKFWARIKNNLIVYTTKEFANEILSIRKDFGLEEKTKVIIVDDYKAFDRDLYNRIEKVMNNDISKTFHKDIKRPESWNVDYNYVVMLKWYCIEDVISKKYINNNSIIAWLDFGFNHGGKDGLINEEDFNFLWEYNFPNKIHLFTHQKIDVNIPIFEIVRNMDVYIRGNIMVAYVDLWRDFILLAKESMLSLLRCGLCDDDQTIELMAYYERPELFEIHDVDTWYDGLKLFGGEHFIERKKEYKKNKKYKLYKKKAKAYKFNGSYKKAIRYYIKYYKEKYLHFN